jgi:hypothetical protein
VGKAVAQDLVDAGFREELFPGVVGFLSDYLPRVLTAAARWAEALIGDAAYASATASATTAKLRAAFEALRAAEIAAGSAELWERRAATVEANAVAGLTGLEYLNRREYFEQARQARERAREHIERAAAWLDVSIDDTTPGSGIAVGHVETGRYPAASATAVTA